jgi:hypothetical protein
LSILLLVLLPVLLPVLPLKKKAAGQCQLRQCCRVAASAANAASGASAGAVGKVLLKRRTKTHKDTDNLSR